MLSIYSRRITKEQRVLPQINFKTNKDNFADHHAPLHKRQHDGWAFKDLNTAGALSYWASQGAPEHKLLLGTPFYGRTFTLADPNQSKPGARSSGPGKGGEFTEEPGIRRLSKRVHSKMSQTEIIVLRLLGLQRNLPPDEGRRMGETTRL